MIVLEGVAVVLIGDTGKLLAISGHILWEQNPKTENEISGLNMVDNSKLALLFKRINSPKMMIMRPDSTMVY